MTEAIQLHIGELVGALKMTAIGTNCRKQNITIVKMSVKGAEELLKSQHIKIGWVNGRVRRRISVPRGNSCVGYSHCQVNCRGPDRSVILQTSQRKNSVCTEQDLTSGKTGLRSEDLIILV